jgi:translation initiation factor 1
MCPTCRAPLARCSCSKGRKPVATDGIARITLETKGRKGKGVTVIRGLSLTDAALEQLGKDLRGLCASGGTTRDGAIEVQGDHRERVARFLAERGHKVPPTRVG